MSATQGNALRVFFNHNVSEVSLEQKLLKRINVETSDSCVDPEDEGGGGLRKCCGMNV